MGPERASPHGLLSPFPGDICFSQGKWWPRVPSETPCSQPVAHGGHQGVLWTSSSLVAPPTKVPPRDREGTCDCHGPPGPWVTLPRLRHLPPYMMCFSSCPHTRGAVCSATGARTTPSSQQSRRRQRPGREQRDQQQRGQPGRAGGVVHTCHIFYLK